MTDVRAAQDWVAVCLEAVAGGYDWRLHSDTYVRGLPIAERVGPYLFASYLDRRQHLGADPREVLQMIETALLIIAVDGADR